ncbi:phage major tail tube protein [Dryocola clanedunensis]
MKKNNLRAWTLFVNGAQRLEGAHEYTPPELAITKVEVRSGGMDMSVPMDTGMEPMVCTFKIYGVDTDALALFGMQVGGKSPRITAYEGYQYTGGSYGKIDEMEGMITKITADARPNTNMSEASVTLEMSLNYYRSSVDGRELFEIIPEQFVRRVNGVDVLAGLRSKVRL